MPVKISRRSAICTISVAVVAAGGTSGTHNAFANTASARLGARLAKERGAPFALDLAHEATARPSAQNIAEEYRQGRTIVIAGILYSRSEAAAFSHAALQAGMVPA